MGLKGRSRTQGLQRRLGLLDSVPCTASLPQLCASISLAVVSFLDWVEDASVPSKDFRDLLSLYLFTVFPYWSPALKTQLQSHVL